jgi:broad specificity phosphatase PhoE
MKPNRIILIRHGESQGNVDKSIYANKPDYALELSEKGIEQAKDAGIRLKEIIKDESAFFYVSPLWRTRMTFEGISVAFEKDKIGWIEEPRIREQEFGHLKSQEENEKIDKERDSYGPFYYRIPDGESGADVYDRVSDFFGTIQRDFEKPHFPQNAIIVSHGMAIRLFLMKWFHWTVEQFEELGNLENCQIILLEIQENGKYALKTELKKHKVKHSYQRPIKL